MERYAVTERQRRASASWALPTGTLACIAHSGASTRSWASPLCRRLGSRSAPRLAKAAATLQPAAVMPASMTCWQRRRHRPSSSAPRHRCTLTWSSTPRGGQGDRPAEAAGSHHGAGRPHRRRRRSGMACRLRWPGRCAADPQNIKIKEVMHSGVLGKVFMVRRRHGLGVTPGPTTRSLARQA